MDNLELMEKWHSLAALHGIDIEEITDCWSNDDDEDLMLLLADIETMNRRMANPTKEMRFALLTSEMGVTTNDINEYESHRYYIAEEEAERVRALAVAANVHIKKLVDVHGYRRVSSKQFPSHMHFAFTTADGIDVKARLFKYSWAVHRIWITWKDAKGKLVRQMWDAHLSDVVIPKGFPTSWTEDYSHPQGYDQVASVIAHMITTKTLPKVAKHLMPKR